MNNATINTPLIPCDCPACGNSPHDPEHNRNEADYYREEDYSLQVTCACGVAGPWACADPYDETITLSKLQAEAIQNWNGAFAK